MSIEGVGMKYEPWKVIEDSFRKHMITAEELQKQFDEKKDDPYFHSDSPEEYFIGQFDHNMEYFKWYVEGATGNVTFGDSNGPYQPLGLFYGQDAGIPFVKQDLRDYVACCRNYLLTQIVAAMYELQKLRVSMAEIQIPKGWAGLVPHPLFGAKRTISSSPRIVSNPEFGRFVPIAGLAIT